MLSIWGGSILSVNTLHMLFRLFRLYTHTCTVSKADRRDRDMPQHTVTHLALYCSSLFIIS